MNGLDNPERSAANPTSVAGLALVGKLASHRRPDWASDDPHLQVPHPLTWLLMSMGKSIVLMRGGIDSSASAVAFRKDGYETSGLFVDYGQPAACSEWRAVQVVANHFDLEVKKVELGFRLVSESGEFFGPNALLVLTAAGITESRHLMITLEITRSPKESERYFRGAGGVPGAGKVILSGAPTFSARRCKLLGMGDCQEVQNWKDSPRCNFLGEPIRYRSPAFSH